MTDPNRFLMPLKQVLEKRAGSICSNPRCKTPTTGPHTEDHKAVNLGEAAHIKGANPGSKRYDERMTPPERSHIINAIWLCGRCAKLIDSDELKYTVDLLYQWKRNHENQVRESMETSGWDQEISNYQLRVFEHESPPARQIVLDKPKHWEYLLTVELVRSKMDVIRAEYGDLRRGLIYRPSRTIDGHDFVRRTNEKMNDLKALSTMFNVILNEELPASWGEVGKPGNALLIKRASDKIHEGCKGLLDWEIDLHFIECPSEFEKARAGMSGWTNAMFEEVDKIWKEISKIFEINTPVGFHEIKLSFKALENMDEVGKHLQEGAIAFAKKNQRGQNFFR